MSFFIQEGLIIVLLFILMLLFDHSGCDNMASGVAVEESRSVAHFIMMPFQKELKLSVIFNRPSGLSSQSFSPSIFSNLGKIKVFHGALYVGSMSFFIQDIFHAAWNDST